MLILSLYHAKLICSYALYSQLNMQPVSDYAMFRQKQLELKKKRKANIGNYTKINVIA